MNAFDFRNFFFWANHRQRTSEEKRRDLARENMIPCRNCGRPHKRKYRMCYPCHSGGGR